MLGFTHHADANAPCPACQAPTARVLEGPSADAHVWYYRCPECGHAWSVSKADETDIHDITPLPKKSRP